MICLLSANAFADLEQILRDGWDFFKESKAAVKEALEDSTPTGRISEWKAVALTPSVIRFTCEQTGERNEKRVIANVRKFKEKTPGYWVRPIGQSQKGRTKDGRLQCNFAADVEHEVWLMASPAMTNGETRVFTLPDDRRVEFTYSSEIPTPIIKIDQLGYVPEAGEKYAYVGDWMGLAGELTVLCSKFRLVNEATGKAVFEGTAKLCKEDMLAPNGAPWVGERPYELDFSSVKDPGHYHLEVDGVGRSDSFVIGNECLAQAFAVHMTGMKRQRCGVDCHHHIYRGAFPPNDFHYGEMNPNCKFGFFDSDDKHVSVGHFQLINDNAERWSRAAPPVLAEGGWHDAADYDRRPFHLQSVGEFAALAMLQPACTAAVEEAWWGIRHLVSLQQDDGGVGTWIEAKSHPNIGEGPIFDTKNKDYFLSLATRESTIEFCAYAAMTALAMNEEDPRRDKLVESAKKAWKFSMDGYGNGGKVECPEHRLKHHDRTIVYRENPVLPGELVLKAGLDLSLLTGDDSYLEPVNEDFERIRTVVLKGNWRWSPFLLIELDVNERQLEPEMKSMYREWRKRLVGEADRLLAQLNTAWAYRNPWYGPKSAQAKMMGWGFGLPLSLARWFVVAHSITWKDKYLDAAYLSLNFHNGCNPEGETYTSGLGIRPTKRYLDLEGKYSPGVTPYRFIYDLEPQWLKLCFPDGIEAKWPIWRRYDNMEILTVKNTEFTVWESIAPAAVVTGYLKEINNKE